MLLWMLLMLRMLLKTRRQRLLLLALVRAREAHERLDGPLAVLERERDEVLQLRDRLCDLHDDNVSGQGWRQGASDVHLEAAHGHF